MAAENLLLSFVIPVYNVQDYLEECVNSILSQMTPECEIILVDDGSTDQSGNMCDAFASERVRVIHQNNGGLSAARNTGISCANGLYLAFVDSDDRVAEGAVAALLDWIHTTPADLCFLQAVKFFPDGSQCPLGDEISHDRIHKHSRTEVFQYLSTRPKYPGSACTKLYRKEYLSVHCIQFPHDRRQSEDLGFVRDCILQAESMDALDMPYYEYRQKREGSITNTSGDAAVLGLLRFVEESVVLLTSDHQPKDETAGLFLSFVAYEYCICLLNYSGLSESTPALWDRVVSARWVLSYGKARKVRAIRLISKVLGLKLTVKLMQKVNRYYS